MAYQFNVLPQTGTLTEPHRVRVQFLDPDGEVLFTADHDPPAPTTAWRPGETIAYQRLMYIPLCPYVGPTSITLGLYSPATGEPLPLVGERIGASGYLAATIALVPPERSSSFPTFQSGWHRAELASGRGWRWSTGEGVLAFLNPRQDSILYFEVAGRPDLFESPQRLDFLIDGRAIDSLLRREVHTASRRRASRGYLRDDGCAVLHLDGDVRGFRGLRSAPALGASARPCQPTDAPFPGSASRWRGEVRPVRSAHTISDTLTREWRLECS